ncbi:MAG TPA: hypothetical protein VJN96_25150 [Vicinamibacterales bacterium]|nr:hypothetical protein [Vicinamibacterales bacterium]
MSVNAGRSRTAAILIAAAIVLALAGRLIDVPSLAGKVKGDEATYVAMTLSLAHDGDLRYEPKDLTRFEAVYRQGPSGVFLKRTHTLSPRLQLAWPPIVFDHTPVSSAERLSYAKAFAYPLLAAPFELIGGLGGMLMLNVMLLGGCIWCAVRFCQARLGKWPGLVLGVAFVVASVVPVFGVFLTSEIFNFSIVLFAYFLWLYKAVGPDRGQTPLFGSWTDVAAAILIGVATYSKPGILIAPMALAGLFQWPRKHWVAVMAAFFLTVGGFFFANKLVTGEWNYQGGDSRKSFYDVYPFQDATKTFESLGGEMSTNDADTGMVLAPETLRLLPVNAWYFLMGRDAGLVPFYFPGVAIVALWLLRIRQSTLWQWATLAAIVGSIGVLLVYFPFTWNGAGGPPGNRYFLAVYPTMLFLLPSGVGLGAALVALVVGVAFTGAMVARPFAAANDTWRNITRAPLRYLPVELTILDDLPVRLRWDRGRIIFVHDPTVFTYFMDADAYDAEADGPAFWVKGKASTDVVLRTEHPLTRIEFDVRSRVPNTVTISFGGHTQTVVLGQDGVAQIRIAPDPPLDVHRSYPYVLHVTTTNGFFPRDVEPDSKDLRYLGALIRFTFTYAPRAELPAAPPPGGRGGG